MHPLRLRPASPFCCRHMKTKKTMHPGRGRLSGACCHCHCHCHCHDGQANGSAVQCSHPHLPRRPWLVQHFETADTQAVTRQPVHVCRGRSSPVVACPVSPQSIHPPPVSARTQLLLPLHHHVARLRYAARIQASHANAYMQHQLSHDRCHLGSIADYHQRTGHAAVVGPQGRAHRLCGMSCPAPGQARAAELIERL